MSNAVETSAFGVESKSFISSDFREESFCDKKGNKVNIYIDTRNKKIYLPKQYSRNVKPNKENLWRFTKLDSATKLSALIRLQLTGVRQETIDRICRDISYRYGIW